MEAGSFDAGSRIGRDDRVGRVPEPTPPGVGGTIRSVGSDPVFDGEPAATLFRKVYETPL